MHGVLARIKVVLASNQVLVGNAGAATTGMLVSAGLGFLYWGVCARAFQPEAVGLAAAAISIMNLIGLVGELSLGTLLVGEALRHGKRGPALISASLTLAFASSLVFASVFTLLWSFFATHPGSLASTGFGAALFIVGAGITGFTLALDQCFVGLLKGSLLMYRGIASSLLKLMFIIAAVMLIHTHEVLLIFSSWILGQLVSVALIAVLLRLQRQTNWHAPDFSLLRPLVGTVLGHHVLNLVTQAPGLLLPFIVASVLSATTNAAFAVGWMVLNVAFLVPASLATVLYTIGAVDRSAVPDRLRFSLFVSLLVGLGTGFTYLLFSNLILGLFNPAYVAIAGASLQLIGFGVLGAAIKFHYIAIKRLQRAMMSASALLGIGGTLEIAFAIAGAGLGGLQGLVIGWLLAVSAQAAFMLPQVLGAAGFARLAPSEFFQTPTMLERSRKA